MRWSVAARVLGIALLAATARGDELTRVSLGGAGQQANGDSYICAVSADGRFVVFESVATNFGAPVVFGGLTPGNIFVRDTETGITTWANQPTVVGQLPIDTIGPYITPDGRYVVFQSKGHNAYLPGVPAGTEFACYRKDLVTGAVDLAQGQPAGTNHPQWTSLPSCSDDGRYVAYVGSWFTGPLPQGMVTGQHIYVYDMVQQTTELVSKNAGSVPGNQTSTLPWISGDGRYVVFNSQSTNLVPGDTNNTTDIFRFDRVTQTIERVSVADNEAQANGQSFSEALGYLSSDGNFVAFTSFANNLVQNDTNGFRDVFVRDVAAGTTERVSIHSDGTTQGNQVSRLGSLSSGGRYVTFTSQSTVFYPGDIFGTNDAFRHDRKSGVTEVISKPVAGASNGSSDFPMTSQDGRYVAFTSVASNLVTGDTNSKYDVFRFRDCWVTLTALGTGTPGSGGIVPVLSGTNGSCSRGGWSIALTNTKGPAVGLMFLGAKELDQFPVFGGHFWIDLAFPHAAVPIVLGGHGPGTGSIAFDVNLDVSALAGTKIVLQAAIADTAGVGGAALSNGLRATIE